jgi:hypothetical protein
MSDGGVTTSSKRRSSTRSLVGTRHNRDRQCGPAARCVLVQLEAEFASGGVKGRLDARHPEEGSPGTARSGIPGPNSATSSRRRPKGSLMVLRCNMVAVLVSGHGTRVRDDVKAVDVDSGRDVISAHAGSEPLEPAGLTADRTKRVSSCSRFKRVVFCFMASSRIGVFGVRGRSPLPLSTFPYERCRKRDAPNWKLIPGPARPLAAP